MPANPIHVEELKQLAVNHAFPSFSDESDNGLRKLLNASDVAKLDDDFDCHAPPTKRIFDWTVHYAQGAPDGFSKRQIMINGQAPGPTIEVNEGDTACIRVRNNLKQGTSIHWHGMFQNSTPFMDGISGFTQCLIPAGSSFEYCFKIQGQFGTYWYHSHTAVQYTDGLYGPLIVHSRNDPYRRGRDYDHEMVVILADNYHDWAENIATQLISPAGYKGSPAAPSPQSALINGRGVYNCSLVSSTCTQLKTPTKDVEPGKTYRLRIINAGSHAFNWVSIDQHVLRVIAADGTPIHKQPVHRIPLHNGQRYDALVTMDVGKPGDSFLLRSRIETACFGVVDTTLDSVGNLTLQYKSSPQGPARPPVPRDWSDQPANNTKCLDLADKMLTPLIPRSVPDNTDPNAFGIFVTQFGFLNLTSTQSAARFFVNNTSYVNYANRPYLETVHNGGAIDPKTISSIRFEDDVWVADIVFCNNDTNVDHPFHLHGVESHLIDHGPGCLTPAQWQARKGTYNTKNPPRRDTFVVKRSTYTLIRIFSDNPGVWPLHCHIAFHLAQGFMGAVEIHPRAIRQLPFPKKVLDLCPTDAASLNKMMIP
ncbi:hypothetical protein ACQY0O_007976 [Thecaphora frezii]